MKKIKLLIMILLLTGIMVFHTESNKIVLEGKINKNGYSKEYFIEGKKIEEFLRDIEKYSEKYKVKYIMMEFKKSNNIDNYKLYGDKESLGFLKNTINQKEDTEIYKLKTIFTGYINVEFKSIKEVADLNIGRTIMYGEKNSIENLDSKLIDKYGGGAPIDNGSSKGIEQLKIAIYSMYLLTYLVFTIYEVEAKRRETVVKYINGDSILKLIIKKLILEVVLITGIFVIILTFFMSKGFLKENIISIIKLFMINIIISGIIYSTLFNIDIKKTFSKNFFSKKFKIINFTTLTVVSTLFLFISIANGVTFKNFYSALKQKENWEKRKEEVYIDFMYKPDDSISDSRLEETDNVKIAFFDKFHKSFDMKLSEFDKDSKTIFLSKEYINRLDEKIKLDKKTMYILYNDNVSLDELRLYDNLVKGYKNVYKKIDQKELFIYDGKSNTLFENYARFNYIIVDNTKELKFEKTIMGMTFRNYSILIKDNKKYNEFIKKYNMDDYIFKKESLYSNYKNKFHREKNIFVFSLLINFLLFVMLWFLISLTIKIEFIENAMKIIIKKLTGSNLFERYRKIIITLLIFSLFTMILSISLLVYLNLYKEIIISIVVLGIYSAIICFQILNNINKYEKKNINKIIKGGEI